jgi:hypothetical protein
MMKRSSSNSISGEYRDMKGLEQMNALSRDPTDPNLLPWRVL